MAKRQLSGWSVACQSRPRNDVSDILFAHGALGRHLFGAFADCPFWFVVCSFGDNQRILVAHCHCSSAGGILVRTHLCGTVVNAIPLAQPLLDAAVKYILIDFMQNPMWRHAIKTQTKGYIGNPNQNGENNAREKNNSKED
jgi:hypothetical protein